MKIPTMKDLILYTIIGSSAIAVSSCGTTKHIGNLNFKLVNEVTTNTFSMPYNQMERIMELTDSMGLVSKDNEHNTIKTYQILAKGLVEYEVQNEKGKVEKKQKTKEHSLEAITRHAVDTIDNTYTAQIVESATKDKKGNVVSEKYFILTGTNIYNDNYIEMYKIKMDGDKLSTKEEDWTFQVTDVKTSESSGFIKYNNLEDNTKTTIENRINYMNAIFFPNNSPATKGFKVIKSKNNKGNYKRSTGTRKSKSSIGNGLFD